LLRLLALTAVLTLGCSGSAADRSVSTSQAALYGGVASGPEDDFVVRLEAFDNVGLKFDCSGAVIHPRIVLTARHCVFHFNPPPFECGADGELASAGDGGKYGSAHDASQISVFYGPGFPLEAVAHGTSIIAGDAPSLCRDDVAFLLLDQPIAAPPVSLRLFESVEVGERVSVIGYGVGEGEKQFRKRLSGLEVEAVGPEQVDPADDSLTPPRSFALGRSTCSGDSGGPAISDQTGAIVGVASWRSNLVCEAELVRNFFPRIAPHADLLDDAFTAVGGEPLIEGVSSGGECSDCEDSGCALASSGHGSSHSWLWVVAALVTRRAQRVRRWRAPR
jgi:hypothetical protein